MPDKSDIDNQMMSGGITNCDPFADSADVDDVGKMREGFIHIRIQQRNGRKTLTTVQGIDCKYDLKKLTKFCKKTFQCNGTVVQHDEYGEIIQLQGDNREDVKNLLTNVGIADAERIKNKADCQVFVFPAMLSAILVVLTLYC